MHIAIAGAGIAGLTCALACQRRGFEVSVFEASPGLTPVGKGIWVPPNAMQVMERLGVAQQIAARGWPLDSITLRTMQGTPLTSVDLRRVAARHGHTTISIRRSTLIDCLAAPLAAGVVQLSKRLQHWRAAGSGVELTFEDGAMQRADLLVGADGLRSRVREGMWPGLVPREAGQTCYLGIASLALPEARARECNEIWGGPRRFGYSAVGPGHVYWFAPVTGASSLTRDDLIQCYAGFPAPVPQILVATPAPDIMQTVLAELPALSHWRQGRAVLLGDAAHAMTPNLGQGGAQAVEDAFVLVEALAREDSVEAALAAYESLRQPRVGPIKKRAWQLGQMSHWENPAATWLRNLTLRLLPRRLGEQEQDRIYHFPG
ncbi:MAG: FAD-dependent monooxygenase [Bryobacterales bacterium]|nr:FAD-dependent monooxygenase [Bryobacterales bacterium]